MPSNHTGRHAARQTERWSLFENNCRKIHSYASFGWRRFIAEPAIAHSATCFRIKLTRDRSQLTDTCDRCLIEMKDFTGEQRKFDSAATERNPLRAALPSQLPGIRHDGRLRWIGIVTRREPALR